PRHGIHSPGESGFLDYLKHLILPAFTLGIAAAAYTARFQRSALLEVIRQDYIRTARAKGLSETRVIWKHAMKNALLPTITLLGLYLPFLVSGAIITESIFAWPGMGQASIKAILDRDVQVVTAITIVSTSMVVLGSLVADILYAVVDPRVRLS
ncbi:MAG: ABC transporter permease, partial [Planctomycetota bacterium]|nr:ABC transporter permease [Planctomycetota bacterium]